MRKEDSQGAGRSNRTEMWSRGGCHFRCDSGSRGGVGVNDRVEEFAVPNFTCIFSGQRATIGLLSVAQ